MESSDLVPVLELARRGDEKALDELFRQYYPAVQRMVHRWLAQDVRAKRPWIGSLFSTGDVVQEVFTGVLCDLESFRGRDEKTFVKFLSTMVKNRILEAVRRYEAYRRDGRRSVARGESLQGSAAPGPDPADAAAQREAVDLFRAAVETLAARERALIRMRLEGDEPYRGIADQLGYPSEEAARKAFRVTRARLLARLGIAASKPPNEPGGPAGAGGAARVDG